MAAAAADRLLRAPDGGAGSPRLPREAARDLIDRVRAYDPRADVGLIATAFDLAEAAHAGQLRDDGTPYFTHPVAVAGILAGYRLDAASIATALLHDTVEDTGLTLPALQARVGPAVAGLVDGVTKLNRLELQSDRTRQAENFRKLVLAMSRDIRVLLVKLADRLHNMRTLSGMSEPSRRLRIARETMEIYAPLAERIGMDAVRTELQTLSFAEMEPEASDTITTRLAFLRGQGADVIDEVAAELRRVIGEGGVTVREITGREKSPFSIWAKMKSRRVEFEQLSDIMAFRVVVPTRGECYAALGAVHAAFPVIAGRFKDYISTPKANGYRSLHTGVTLRVPHNQKIEVQIRDPEMHDVAENGLAAHWIYKAHDGAAAEAQRFGWVQDLLEILENSSAEDVLENTRLELYQDQVFCFTPKGELIPLPRGATPVDFAYAVHSQVGDTCVGAKINGRIMPLRQELQNGDQVEIMTARGGTPSPQWERFVVTGKARARIRRFVLQQQRQQHLDAGRAALARAFRQEGLDGSERVLEPALKTLKCATVADLHAAVGAGTLTPRDVLVAAYPDLREAPRAPRMLPTLPARSRPTTAVPISGLVAGMAVHYAGCCLPLPGDPIVGIVTTGKGVTVHTRGCPNLETFSATPERFMEIDWDAAAGTRRPDAKAAGHTGRVRIIADQDDGMLATVANTVAKHHGAVAAMQVVSRQTDFCELLLDVEVRDLRHLSTVIAGLRAAGGIHQAERTRG